MVLGGGVWELEIDVYGFIDEAVSVLDVVVLGELMDVGILVGEGVPVLSCRESEHGNLIFMVIFLRVSLTLSLCHSPSISYFD